MAVVGDAYVVVRALTDKVQGDIRRGFAGTEGIGRRAGEGLGSAFTRGFNRGSNVSVFTKFSSGLKAMLPDAEAVRESFQKLVGRGYLVGTMLGQIIGLVSALGGGLLALAGNAAGAAASIVVLGNVFAAFGLAMLSAKIALGGVGKALGALNKQAGGGGQDARVAALKRVEEAERALAQVVENNRNSLIDANNAVRDAQLSLNEAIKQGQEEIQQLGFDAEDAALSEQRAAIELEKARETLLRVQDLPPNSRARREAELAYAEAELNLRRAKDRSSDLNAEQDRLAQTGVAGTEVVINATNALIQAEENKNKVILEGIRAEIQAEQSLADAKEAAAKAGGGAGGNPFEGLNQAQITFVKELNKLRPRLKEIKIAMSEAFLPPLLSAIQLVDKELGPTIATGLGQIAAATGEAVGVFAAAVTESRNVAGLAQLFTNSSKLITGLASVLGNLFGIFISLLNAAAPVAERFVKSIENSTKRFDEYLKSVKGSKETQEFFKKSGDAAAQFGRIFGNLFAGFGAVINANLGPGTGGQYLLDWLERATSGLRTLDDTAEKQDGLQKYFLDVAKNVEKIMSSIGALLSELSGLGADPVIGETFDILKEGAPALASIITKSAAAGPALATLAVNLTEIFDKLTDTGAIEVFFGTLNLAAERINDLLDNEVLMNILTVTGQIFAMGAAFRILQSTGTFAVKVLAGSFIGLETVVMGPSRMFGLLHTKLLRIVVTGGPVAKTFALMGASMTKVMKGPFGIALGVIALLVTAFTVLYNTNEEFKATVDALVASMMPLIQNILPNLMTALQPVITGFMDFAMFILPRLMGIMGQVAAVLGPVFMTAFAEIGAVVSQVMPQLITTFQVAGQAIGGAFIALLPVLADAFTQIVQAVAPLIPVIVNALLPAFVQIIAAIAPLIPMLIQQLVPAFVMIINAVIPLVTQLITTLVPAITTLITAIVPLITTLITSLVPAFAAIIQAVVPLITMIIETLVPIITTLIQTIVPLVTLIIEQLVPVFVAIVEAIVPIVETIINALVPVIQFLIPIFAGIITVVMNVVRAVIQFLLPIIVAIIGAFTGFIAFLPRIGQTFMAVFNGIVGFFRGIANFLIGMFEGLINGIIASINGFTAPLRAAIGGIAALFGKNIVIGVIPQVRLPRLAKGGIVAPTPGGTIAQIAEAGRAERIEPLDINGMSKRDKAIFDMMSKAQQQSATPQVNITVNPSAGMDERALAMMVSEELTRTMRKGSIR